MKKAMIFALLISILITLSGCTYNQYGNLVTNKVSEINSSTTASSTNSNLNTDRESIQTQPENTTNATDTAMRAYKAVLQNKSQFYNTDDKKNQYFNDFLVNNETFEVVFKVLHFTVLDMDNDKIPEVIIELAIDGHDYGDFYEVMHYVDDKVNGYIFSNRCLGGVKADGTFFYSGGARDNGFGKLIFQGSTSETNPIGFKESQGDNEAYFIDNKQVTPDKYESFQNAQFAKEEPTWYKLSQNSIDKEFSINSSSKTINKKLTTSSQLDSTASLSSTVESSNLKEKATLTTDEVTKLMQKFPELEGSAYADMTDNSGFYMFFQFNAIGGKGTATTWTVNPSNGDVYDLSGKVICNLLTDKITISISKISDLLSTKNSDVIKLLGISDSNQTQYIGRERFYEPLFCCKTSGIFICFDGSPFDSIEQVKQIDGNPDIIIPIVGTTIDFGNNHSFLIGDDIKLFKSIFGEGKATSDWNLQGDKKINFLTYNINNLTITIESLNGNDFTKYMMDITKS